MKLKENKIEKMFDVEVRYMGKWVQQIRNLIVDATWLNCRTYYIDETDKHNTCWVIEYKELLKCEKDALVDFLQRTPEEVKWDIDEYEMVKGGE